VLPKNGRRVTIGVAGRHQAGSARRIGQERKKLHAEIRDGIDDDAHCSQEIDCEKISPRRDSHGERELNVWERQSNFRNLSTRNKARRG